MSDPKPEPADLPSAVSAVMSDVEDAIALIHEGDASEAKRRLRGVLEMLMQLVAQDAKAGQVPTRGKGAAHG